MNTDLFGSPVADAPMVQGAFAYPVSLTERYRPQSIAEFVGLDKPKKIAQNLVATPRQSNWLFVGPSGTGKTSLGMAIAACMPAELHLIPSQECNLATIDAIHAKCHFVPHSKMDMRIAYQWHLVLADEIDQLTQAAQISLLSKLDSTNPFPQTIFIGTCNDTTRLEPRFLSRFHTVKFSTEGLNAPCADLLADIWTKEMSGKDAPVPNFARWVKESNNNVRESLMRLETEMMAA